jgi:hypothetical protein
MNLNATFFNGRYVLAIATEAQNGQQFVSVTHWGIGILHSIGSQYNHLTDEVADVSRSLASDDVIANFMFEGNSGYNWTRIEVDASGMPISRGVADVPAIETARRVILAAIAHQATPSRLSPMPAVGDE